MMLLEANADARKGREAPRVFGDRKGVDARENEMKAGGICCTTRGARRRDGPLYSPGRCLHGAPRSERAAVVPPCPLTLVPP